MSRQRAMTIGAMAAALGAGIAPGFKPGEMRGGQSQKRKSRRKPRNIFFRVAPPPPKNGMPRPVKPRLSESLAPTHPLVRWVEGYKKGETTWESL